MSTIADNHEKIFKYYSVFPPEIRIMIVDEMQPVDSCIFNTWFEELWTEELDSSIDLVQHAAEKFKNLLIVYQNKIKKLSFFGSLLKTTLKNYDFGMENLKKLKVLHGITNIISYLWKLRHPMKQIILWGEVNEITSEDNNPIYQVSGIVCLRSMKFTYEQMLRLSASKVFIHIGDLTAHDIANFIQSWRNGTIGKEIINYQWGKLDDSNFDTIKLFQLLGKVFYDNAKGRRYSLKIKQNKKYGEIARLLWFKGDDELIFRLEDDTNDTWSNKSIQELDDNYSYFLRTVSNEL